MTLSLPLRLNLIGLAFTTTLALTTVSIGGQMIYQQQKEATFFRAQYAATELANRAIRLLNLQLEFRDFLDFEEQCAEVIANDPLLNTAALFDISGVQLFRSIKRDLSSYSSAVASAGGLITDIRVGSDWLIIFPITSISQNLEGYTVVLIDHRAYSKAVNKPLFLLVLVSVLFLAAALLIQQHLFRLNVGKPLARLVATANSLHAADPERIAMLKQNESDDDIGRIYRALSRLMGSLRDANDKLVRQNNELDRIVKRRTEELQDTNAKLETDIKRRIALEEELRVMAGTDSLTRLPNRSSLDDKLRWILLEADRHKWVVAVLFIDLDHFKVINDTHGHQIGDKLLIEVSHRLVSAVRRSDIVARLGGDEFMIILPDIMTPDNAGMVSTKILKILSQQFVIDGIQLTIGASIGISMAPDDSQNPHTLMQSADTAMYHAKGSGRNNYQFFNSLMFEKVRMRLGIETRIRNALVNHEFLLHYQPQILTNTRRLSGVEALIRWLSPEGELISPDQFIGIAEDTGLIIPLGRWVLEEACRQMAEWKQAGLAIGRMAVNLSPRQFSSPDLLKSIIDILEQTRLPASSLQLEITESSLMNNPDEAIRVLKAFRDLGIDLAIDDFGTGYSSFSYLRFLPVQRLKIDRSFIARIEADNDDSQIVAAIITLAQGLGLGVIAEGVETKNQLDLLQSKGCREVQGFLFSPPLPAAEFVAWYTRFVRNNSPVSGGST